MTIEEELVCLREEMKVLREHLAQRDELIQQQALLAQQNALIQQQGEQMGSLSQQMKALQDRLAKDMGMTRPRVTQLIGELEQAGLIEIERRGQGKTNLYTINFVVKKKASKT